MAALPRSHSSTAIDQLSRGYEGLTQLRALLSSSEEKSSTMASANRLLDKAQDCITAALSELQISSVSRLASSDENNKDCTEACKSHLKTSSTCERLKRIQKWTIVTSVPHFDGHQWRKYGEKHIHRSKFPRSYYKCSHNKDQGCPATKTIQQKEKDCNPPKYEVIYSMQHICKTMETPLVKEYSSATINNSSSTTTPSTSSSYVLHTSSFKATSPQPLPTLVPMESMLPSTEPQIEENGMGSSSIMSPFIDFDFDLEWLKQNAILEF